MTRERVGYRRLYDAIGCSLAEGSELRIEFPMRSPLSAQVYLGPKPSFGISIQTAGDGFIVPGEENVLVKVEHKSDASQSSYPRKFFTEVCCSLEVNVPEDVSAAFHQKDTKARDEVLRLAEEHEAALKNTADFVAGVVGLRFHRQFVIKVICENFYALREDGPVIQSYGPWAEVLQGLALNPQGAENLAAILKVCGQGEPGLQEFAGDVFGWLLRAWTERDSVSRFLSLFVPLEMILQGQGTGEPAAEWETIRELIKTHAPDLRQTLLAFLDRVQGLDRPSLNERFEAMARGSGHPGWEADVQAFRKFNALRNALLHRGDPRVKFHVTVGDDEAKEMGDLVERYVSLRFFQDMAVYPSKWRPRTISPQPRVAEESSSA